MDDALMSPEEEKFLAAGSPAPEDPALVKTPVVENATAKNLKSEIVMTHIQIPLSRGLAPLNLRIQPALKTDLLRVSMNRKIQGIEPFTYQDIVSEALHAWFKANGYA
jgi:hypothetical protein